MEVFVNELSLHGQFDTISAFLLSLKEMLSCRRIAENYAHPLYCSRGISHRPVALEVTFQQAVQSSHDRNLIRIVTSWLDKHGPFWDEVRTHPADEWFEHLNEVVTDSTLGEAAYKIIHNIETATLSVQPSAFMYTPLTVLWKRNEFAIETIEILNFWLAEMFEQHCLSYRPPVTSWRGLIDRLRSDFTYLTLLDSVSDGLSGEPFNLTIASQIERLFIILNQLKTCFDAQGSMTAVGHQLMENFFQGDRARFSDESEINKHRFRQEMTFRKPDGEMIFCPYHGKINYRYFRVHFSWPIRHNEPLYIAYIGPKITKG